MMRIRLRNIMALFLVGHLLVPSGAAATCAQDVLKKLFDENHWNRLAKAFEAEKAALRVEGQNPYQIYFSKYPKQMPELPLTHQKMYENEIPSTLWKHYDLKSGTLDVSALKTHWLSSETGREPLKGLRMAVSNTDWSLDLLRDNLRVLDQIPDLKLLVSVPESELAAVKTILSKSRKDLRKRVILVRDEGWKASRVWTQDGSKPQIVENASNPFKTMVTENHHRPEYKHLLDHFDEAGVIEADQTPIFFEGGNVIVGDSRIFAGSKNIEKNMEIFKISRPNARELLSRAWGKPVTEVGVTHINRSTREVFQPDFHIDLTFAVAHDYRKKKEVVLLGSFDELLKRMAKSPAGEMKIKRERAIAEWIEDPSLMKDLANRELQVEVIEQQMKELGYEVVRVPNLVVGSKPLLNYTNVIFSGHHVVMPDNGFRYIDDQMKELFSQMGYQPIPMKVVRESSTCQGGIRCLSETYRSNRVKIDNESLGK